ncbi:MAG: DUF2834 domain-containing protein [Gemmobacter sp.]|jgi:hypothetical protein|nr:DUF2834 domain-containing protein [Gemmobacter sp.]
MKVLYAILCIIGAVLPLSQFVPWLAAHGLSIPLLLQQAVSTPVAAFAWADVLVSALVAITFIHVEGHRLGMPHLWLPLLCCIVVGPSLGLPLFLLLREHRLENVAHARSPLDAHAEQARSE